MDEKKPLEEQEAKPVKKHHVLRNLVCTVVFLCLVAAGFVWANYAVNMKGSVQNVGMFRAFYDTQNDTVDVGYIGTSAASRFFVNPLAYEADGISTFTVGIQNTPIFLYDNLMDEFQTKQHPKVWVIELRPLLKDDELLSEESCRGPIDSVSILSPNRIGMIDESIENMTEQLEPGTFDDNRWEYIVPIFKYHSRIAKGDITLEDMLAEKPYNVMQGFACSKATLTEAPQSMPEFSDKVGKLSDVQKSNLQELLDYCETLDAQVLFVVAPLVDIKFADPEQVNAIERYVEKRGWDCLNFNTEEMFTELGLNPATDFYNKRHVNYLGAEKYTSWLSAYLSDTYNLPDRRGDSSYDAWERGYEKYEKYVSGGIKYHSDKDAVDG